MSKLKKMLYPAVHCFNRAFFTLFFRLNRWRYRLELLHGLEGERVMILAPHTDDEVIGCGGLMNFLAQNSAAVKCVYLTDGSQSIHPFLTPAELAEARQKEGGRVSEFYGIEEPSFLGAPDGELAADEGTVLKLCREIKSFSPGAVFLPSLLDGHTDHTTASELLLEALGKEGFSDDFPLFLYQVNSPLTFYLANRCCLLGKEEESIKKNALQIFASQTLPFEGFLTLDRCRRAAVPRAFKKGRIKAAEFFRSTTKIEHEYLLSCFSAAVYSSFRQVSRPHTLTRDFFSGWHLKKEAGEKLKNYPQKPDNNGN